MLEATEINNWLYNNKAEDKSLPVQDVPGQRGAGWGFDHNLLRGKLFFLYCQMKWTGTEGEEGQMEKLTVPKYNGEGLQHESIRILYQERLDRKLEELV